MPKMKMMPMVMMAVIMLISLYFVSQGIGMHMQVDVEEAEFHALQEQYFSQSKTVRDAAPTGSALNNQLVEIQKFPSELLKLKLIGIGSILTGIFALLFGILIALIMMPIRLGKIIMEK